MIVTAAVVPVVVPPEDEPVVAEAVSAQVLEPLFAHLDDGTAA